MTAHLLDVTGSDYHRDDIGAEHPALSASLINVLLTRSPRHAWQKHPRLNPGFQRTEDQRFDVGSAAHRLFLEGEDAIAVVPYDSWRTKAAKELADDARANGQIPLLPEQADQVHAMVDALRRQLRDRDDQPALFADGKPEQTIVWQEGDVTCKARLDYLNDAHTLISDLKTTKASANPDAWQRTGWSIGIDVQACMYMRAVSSLNPSAIVPPEFRYVTVEAEPPYCMAVFGLAPSAIEIGNRKIDYALTLWADCLRKGSWPSYSQNVAFIEAPGWAQFQWEERLMREEDAA